MSVMTKAEWEFLANLLYDNGSPMAMACLDKLDELAVEYGVEGDNE